ncbi:HNH endonuclease [Desulfococcus multivorans]|uniref:HNH endonuclease n=1 Tax=Desulfococcus multivorans DSM 2059 TaxID=1121405 RepID=S7TRG6_DESML|nr:HNH endonuclease [Desulfococcus multivorans]AOY60565.1 HNH endonuclease family protein [Desulfococcus multivorans]EPR39727.1 HNH endonuclease [Desulfococcus multivorans DSM 2059]SKA04824.1 HNH endonuclease [Desulfococcus multivorans DSM 2059]
MTRRTRNGIDPFAAHLEDSDIRRERRKAREIRSSQWWKRQLAKGRCHYCGSAVAPKYLTMDHIVPISRGGRSTKGNVVPACKACNNRKKQLLPMEWDAYLASLDSA